MEDVQGIGPQPISLGQSLILVWPHLTDFLALASLFFATAYLKFLREEVRPRVLTQLSPGKCVMTCAPPSGLHAPKTSDLPCFLRRCMLCQLRMVGQLVGKEELL